MKKEIIYLSLPDYCNKHVYTNFNQKFRINNSILLKFKLSNILHLGSALKAIYLLEIIFPRKVSVLKILLKKKKLYFGQKSNNLIFFSFNLNLSNFEFIEFFRFFNDKPSFLKNVKLNNQLFINKKLKQFDFNNNVLVDSSKLDTSFFILNFYHLN